MLRIQVDEQPGATTLCIEAKLGGDCVDELRRVWTAKRNKSPKEEIVIDLFRAGGR